MRKAHSPLTAAVQAALDAERRAWRDRRGRDRRVFPGSPPGTERRSGHDRRRIQRRENPAGHLRNALQVLMPLIDHTELDAGATEIVRSAVRRIVLALRELERQRMHRRS